MISPGYGQSARAMLFKSVPTGERFSQKRWILRLTWNQWHNDFGTLRGNLINLLIISDKIRYKRSSTAPVRIDNSFHDLLHPLPPFLFQNRTIFPTFRMILDPLEAGGQSIHGALHFFCRRSNDLSMFRLILDPRTVISRKDRFQAVGRKQEIRYRDTGNEKMKMREQDCTPRRGWP